MLDHRKHVGRVGISSGLCQTDSKFAGVGEPWSYKGTHTGMPWQPAGPAGSGLKWEVSSAAYFSLYVPV
jgi:hypothetical protein